MYLGGGSQKQRIYSGLQPGCVFAQENPDAKCCWLRAYHGPPLPWLGGLFSPRKLGKISKQIFSDGLKPRTRVRLMVYGGYNLLITKLGSIHFQRDIRSYHPHQVFKVEIFQMVVHPKKGTPSFGILYPHPMYWYIYLHLVDFSGTCRELYYSHGWYGYLSKISTQTRHRRVQQGGAGKRAPGTYDAELHLSCRGE